MLDLLKLLPMLLLLPLFAPLLPLPSTLLLLLLLLLFVLLLPPLSSPRLPLWLLRSVLRSPPSHPPSSTPTMRRRTLFLATATLTVPDRSQEMLSPESPDPTLMDSELTTMLLMGLDSVTSNLLPATPDT